MHFGRNVVKLLSTQAVISLENALLFENTWKAEIELQQQYEEIQSQYEEKIQATKIIGSDPSAKEEHLLISDIIAAVSYYFNLSQGFRKTAGV